LVTVTKKQATDLISSTIRYLCASSSSIFFIRFLDYYVSPIVYSCVALTCALSSDNMRNRSTQDIKFHIATNILRILVIVLT
jgi:hypothetical protein